MADSAHAIHLVERAARDLLEQPRRFVLAVSGGIDSMVLLEAAARCGAVDRGAIVATFDHGTGDHALRAIALVERRASELGLRVVRGAGSAYLRGEAAWRRARWSFLRAVSEREKATVASAHTRDDQIETVFMRALRGAGARGLAGLYADSNVARPFIDLSRATITTYASARSVPYIDDPSNMSLAFLRNRVRHELLPALSRVKPTFGIEMLELSQSAAEWRRGVERVARAVGTIGENGTTVRVPIRSLSGLSVESLCVLWPALAALVGVTLDRRGTRRLAEFTITGTSGGVIQLSGGFEVVARRDEMVLRRMDFRIDRSAVVESVPFEAAESTGGVLHFGKWRFRRLASAPPDDPWSASLPAGAALVIRAWRPGDRMRALRGPAARRVKRYLADAGVAGPDRAGWPVVLAGDEIVWIPGVRRGVAATERPGRPGVAYACERIDG